MNKRLFFGLIVTSSTIIVMIWSQWQEKKINNVSRLNIWLNLLVNPRRRRSQRLVRTWDSQTIGTQRSLVGLRLKSLKQAATMQVAVIKKASFADKDSCVFPLRLRTHAAILPK
ncbi:hypothetical protein MOSE0_M01926 [Monosporozyma servazzii]